jgi:hypothetical protein
LFRRSEPVQRDEWETFSVICGLIVIGLGQEALVTLLFTAMAAGSSGNSLVMSALFAGPLQTLQVRSALLRLVHS